MSYFDVGAAEQLIARRGYAGLEEPMGGFLDTIKSSGSAVLDVYKQAQRDKGAKEALLTAQAAAAAAAGRPVASDTSSSGLPSWALPVGLVAVAGVAFLVLKKSR